jgi:hypothetical protein
MKIQKSVERPFADQPSLSPRVAISPYLNERFPPLDQLLTAREVARLVRRPRWYFCGLALLGVFPARRRFRGRWTGWMRSDVSRWMQKTSRVPRAQPTVSYPAKVIVCQRRLPLECTECCPSIRRRRRSRRPSKSNAATSAQVCDVNRFGSRPVAEDRT